MTIILTIIIENYAFEHTRQSNAAWREINIILIVIALNSINHLILLHVNNLSFLRSYFPESCATFFSGTSLSTGFSKCPSGRCTCFLVSINLLKSVDTPVINNNGNIFSHIMVLNILLCSYARFFRHRYIDFNFCQLLLFILPFSYRTNFTRLFAL